MRATTSIISYDDQHRHNPIIMLSHYDNEQCQQILMLGCLPSSLWLGCHIFIACNLTRKVNNCEYCRLIHLFISNVICYALEIMPVQDEYSLSPWILIHSKISISSMI